MRKKVRKKGGRGLGVLGGGGIGSVVVDPPRKRVTSRELKLPDRKALEVGRLVLEWIATPVGNVGVFDVEGDDGTVYTVKVAWTGQPDTGPTAGPARDRPAGTGGTVPRAHPARSPIGSTRQS